MDLETKLINKIMIPYCISIYDGKELQSFYLLDFKSENEMIIESIRYLMRRKYHGYRIYLHNFGKFDSIFLLKNLINLSENIYPILREGNLIELRFKFNKKYILYFRDSYLLLTSSLGKLAKNFKVENKGLFPFDFVNESHIPLDYVGSIPEYKYYNKK